MRRKGIPDKIFESGMLSLCTGVRMEICSFAARTPARRGGMMEHDSYYYYKMGEESVQKNDIDTAIKYYLKSVRTNRHFKTYERLYECYRKVGQPDLADYFLELAYEENPNNDQGAYLYALSLIRNRQEDRAKEILLRIIRRNPDYKKAEEAYKKCSD